MTSPPRLDRLAPTLSLALLAGCLIDHLPGEWDPPYRCQGNEPFWTVILDVDGLRLIQPGEPDRNWPDIALEERSLAATGLDTDGLDAALRADLLAEFPAVDEATQNSVMPSRRLSRPT